MKKSKLLLAALMLLMASGAFAQIRVGVKAGGNLSTFTSMHYDNTKMKFGFHAGVFLDFVFNERLSLQPELLYSAQGVDALSQLTIESVEVTETYSHSFGYINVPVLLKIKIVEGLSAEIGPQVGFLLSAKLKNFEDGVEIDSYNLKDFYEFNSPDVTAIAGLSYTFAENFVVSARYGLGLTKIWKTYDPGQENCKNSVIQLSIGYKF